jgi:hypothetical protein
MMKLGESRVLNPRGAKTSDQVTGVNWVKVSWMSRAGVGVIVYLG